MCAAMRHVRTPEVSTWGVICGCVCMPSQIARHCNICNKLERKPVVVR